eukprot:4907755-Lingulodinium_polyedra.AAC.1
MSSPTVYATKLLTSSDFWVLSLSPRRCLPSFCFSTLAVLLLLIRWAYASRGTGGLEGEKPRKAAQ